MIKRNSVILLKIIWMNLSYQSEHKQPNDIKLKHLFAGHP